VSAGEDATGAVWLYSADARLGRYQDGKLETLNLISIPRIYRMITAENPARSGSANTGSANRGDKYFISAVQFSSAGPPIDQLIRVEKLDFILAGQRGGTWRLINGRVQNGTPRSSKRISGRIRGQCDRHRCR